MSKLLEKLERISEGNGQPLGFGPVVARMKISQMLTIAMMPAGNTESVAAAKEGADALLLAVDNLEKDSKALVEIDHARNGIPWGVSLEAPSKQDIEQLIKLGCDYVIFDPGRTSASVLMEEAIGKVLRLDASLPENLVRAVNRLQVDAVLLNPAGRDEPTFTVYQLMVLERLAANAGKYVLATLPSGLSTADIEILWWLGVRGVVIDMTGEQQLSRVKEAIQKLPTTRKRFKERFRATLPAVGPSSDKEHPDEEEEEE